MTEDQHKTTIIMPEGLYARIRRIAQERGESMGQVIREALENTVDQYQPKLRILGIGDSGRSDISERIDELYDPEL
jgi:metal-responsive CopG/Arc/MetJ family transcriptional regulator